jgi:predicted Zn-dependent peptidase
MFTSYSWFLTYLDKLAQVTPANVQKAAQKYLRPRNRVVGTYIPTGKGEAA